MAEQSIFFKRQSKRSYLDKEVPADVLDRILEKVRWSPSCANNQPWRFVFVSEPEQHAKFVDALPGGNKWAAKAPILIAVCARPEDSCLRKDGEPVTYSQFDCGLAVMSLLLASVEEGLMGHPMAGYDAPKLHAALDIPAEYHIICIISLGYPGSIDLLDERTRASDESPRTRKPLSDTISWNRFDF